MAPVPYSTMDFRQEIVRTRRARRRNIVLVLLVVIVVIALIAVFVLGAFQPGGVK